MTISPDGKNLYAAGQIDNALAVFSRNSTTGSLTFVEIQKDGVGTVDGLSSAVSVTASPDGKNVYAAGLNDKAVAVFNRNSTTGSLTFMEIQKDGVGTVDGLDGVFSVTVSPDGKNLYAASEDDDAVAVFDRDSSTGVLTFVEVQKNGVGIVDGLDGASSVTVSPDGRHLYAAGLVDNAVAVFSVASADLSVTKSDSPDPVVAGNTLTYTIIIANNGPDTSISAVLTDPLPAGVTFSSASSGCNESGGTVTCDIGALAPSASTTAIITVSVDSSTTGTLTNSASVSGTENDPDSSNNTASETTTVSSPTPVPAVSQWALITLAILMSTAIVWRFRRRPAPAR